MTSLQSFQTLPPAPYTERVPPDNALASALSEVAHMQLRDQMRTLLNQKLDRLPLPGAGRTLERWQALSLVSRHSLSLAKLYEGHTDAIAILRELSHGNHSESSVWAMWAAEEPGKRVVIERVGSSDDIMLSGTKSWCSGAMDADNALLTAWFPDQKHSQLVAVAMNHPHISISTDRWHAVGMADTQSAEVRFQSTPATLVGVPGDYLNRRGFWHGGAGVAACWYGGTLAVADALLSSVKGMSHDHPGIAYRSASLGQIDWTLATVGALLRESAAWIDAHPDENAMALALRLRQAAGAAANDVLIETGRALGATPFCREPSFARAAADLPVFIRQSHGDRDDAALAKAVIANKAYPWAL